MSLYFSGLVCSTVCSCWGASHPTQLAVRADRVEVPQASKVNSAAPPGSAVWITRASAVSLVQSTESLDRCPSSSSCPRRHRNFRLRRSGSSTKSHARAHLRRRLGQAEQDRRRETQQRSPRYRKRLLRDRSKRRPYFRRRLLRGDQPAALAIHRLRIQALRHPGMAFRFSYFDGLKSKAPGWVTGGFDVSADRFNIEGRAPENSTIDQMRLMMQALLADRFHLVVHHENRDAPAFGLVLARPGGPGPNLQPHPPSDTCPTSTPQADSPHRQAPRRPSEPSSPLRHHRPRPILQQPAQQLRRSRHSPQPARHLAPHHDRHGGHPSSRCYQTGLVGLYDFTLHWERSPDPDIGDAAAPFRGALKSQLGLELKATHAPIDIWLSTTSSGLRRISGCGTPRYGIGNSPYPVAYPRYPY